MSGEGPTSITPTFDWSMYRMVTYVRCSRCKNRVADMTRKCWRHPGEATETVTEAEPTVNVVNNA